MITKLCHANYFWRRYMYTQILTEYHTPNCACAQKTAFSIWWLVDSLKLLPWVAVLITRQTRDTLRNSLNKDNQPLHHAWRGLCSFWLGNLSRCSASYSNQLFNQMAFPGLGATKTSGGNTQNIYNGWF